MKTASNKKTASRIREAVETSSRFRAYHPAVSFPAGDLV
jgi:hypothetical protein